MQEEEDRIEIVIRYLSGKCSADEERKLIDWISQSAVNEAFFTKVKHVWISSIRLQPPGNEYIEEATKEFRNKLLRSLKNEPVKKRIFQVVKLKAISENLLKYVALVIVAFVMGILTKSILGNATYPVKNSDCRKITFESPKGSRSIATLPDGTKVWLNASSKICYSLDFNVADRIVLLEGEAYFDVTTNKSKPFVVKANNLDIKAFGTMFNVKAYPEENQVITTLLQGKVTIEGIDKTNKKFSLQMDPNQCVIYNTERKSVADSDQEDSQKKEDTVSNDAVKAPLKSPGLPVVKRTLEEPQINTSWKDQRWIIANEDLESLAVMLERRFNVNIRFLDEESKEYHFTGIIENETIEQVLKILCLTVPVKYKIDRNNVELVLNKELKNTYINALKSNSYSKPISN